MKTARVRTYDGYEITVQVSADEYERLATAGRLIATPETRPADKARRVRTSGGGRGKPVRATAAGD